MRLKQSSFLLVLTILLLSSVLYPQEWMAPESVVLDPNSGKLLVSNTFSGDIFTVSRTDPTELGYFSLGTNSGMIGARGLTIVGNTLWAASTVNDPPTYTQALVGYDLLTANVISTIPIAGGGFINDVTADPSGILFLSDNTNTSSTIYRVDPATGTYTIFLSGPTQAYNGLLIDSDNNRLLFTDDAPAGGSRIAAIDLTTNIISDVCVNPSGVEFCDGLTMDHLGTIYFSVWSWPNQIMLYNEGTGIVRVASSEHNGIPHMGAADIYFDHYGTGKVGSAMSSIGALIVPNMIGGTGFGSLDIIPFEQLSTDEDKVTRPSHIKLHQNHPNPFNPTTTISYEVPEESLVKITIYNLLGSEIMQLVNRIEMSGEKNIKWNGRDYKGELVNGGIYLYKLEIDNYVETKKMVLLK